ncbi:hypothetical protein AB0M41_09970 [Streptomyces sp. NPDC051896]|uniref:hypothetical protein n=1 Tax=Streptomyces sp. NPDC051896 TaxID=3155416 RepID=UPI00342E112F
MPDPAGYTYGTDEVARSPVSLAELDELRGTVGLTEEDEHYLPEEQPEVVLRELLEFFVG